MLFNQEVYRQYIHELRTHLFGDMPFEQLIKNIANSHRKRRFVAMYLLQDKTLFHTYYDKRKELGLETMFNQILSTLFYQKEEHPIKQEIISFLDAELSMIKGSVSPFQIKEMMKDINSFILYQNKNYTGMNSF
ncbi:hypothetical protein PP175_29480 (plasmid) [Aneurinibacillus sp. Ricciae_BoGa-3]|uniref:hypothetical protein n=1 Tax=Aneurinibacillus sp. Ricciae_BoGa-3 TaxID=3022697 RepID=UPI002340C1B4|nr:hypothetical protein [Aneurinibacillus sp. Ricciae_BoGa-3]WCK57324.1 hypothetical protein PP175_29480 [Aneurinibacillus sp. Ricciae_BoGa-3]